MSSRGFQLTEGTERSLSHQHCRGLPSRTELVETDQTHVKGRPLLIEVISEGPHCVPCEYAIAAVEYVCESYPEQVEVRVIETRRASDVNRYLELSRAFGKLLPMPSVLIEGRLIFADIPEPGELRTAIDLGLARMEPRP